MNEERLLAIWRSWNKASARVRLEAELELRKAVLASIGRTSVLEIRPEMQCADIHHEPDPERELERARLGLLGRISARPCIIQSYNGRFGADDLRACLLTHLAAWRERERRAVDPPFLWILSASVPEMSGALTWAPLAGWPTGVYQLGGDVLQVRLVVVSELPRDPTTLLVRLMAGGGKLRTSALHELAALPDGSVVRLLAEPVLRQFREALEIEPNLDPDEREFVTVVDKLWARDEGRS